MSPDDPKISDSPFCYLPFVQLLLNPNGSLSPCCWKHNYDLGGIQKEGLLDIWNGEKLRRLRREFLEGNPVTCAQQIRHIGCHKFSHRFADKNLELAELQSGPPRRLDLRLNGKCNLECKMCNVWKQPNGLYDSTDLWNRGPTEIFPYLLEVDVLGGEPFIQRDTFQ